MAHLAEKPRTDNRGHVPHRREKVVLGRKIVGGFYLSMAGVHIGIVAADTETYRTFAEGAYFGFVRTGWAEIFMANPALWGLLVALGEVTIGTMLLAGGRWRKPGWALVIAFHVLLALFGVGFLLWVVPVLAIVVPLAIKDWHRTSPRR